MNKTQFELNAANKMFPLPCLLGIFFFNFSSLTLNKNDLADGQVAVSVLACTCMQFNRTKHTRSAQISKASMGYKHEKNRHLKKK